MTTTDTTDLASLPEWLRPGQDVLTFAYCGAGRPALVEWHTVERVTHAQVYLRNGARYWRRNLRQTGPGAGSTGLVDPASDWGQTLLRARGDAR